MRVNLEKSEKTKATFIFDGWRPEGAELNVGDITEAAGYMDAYGIPSDAKITFIEPTGTVAPAIEIEWETVTTI